MKIEKAGFPMAEHAGRSGFFCVIRRRADFGVFAEGLCSRTDHREIKIWIDKFCISVYNYTKSRI